MLVRVVAKAGLGPLSLSVEEGFWGLWLSGFAIDLVVLPREMESPRVPGLVGFRKGESGARSLQSQAYGQRRALEHRGSPAMRAGRAV